MNLGLWVKDLWFTVGLGEALLISGILCLWHMYVIKCRIVYPEPNFLVNQVSKLHLKP